MTRARYQIALGRHGAPAAKHKLPFIEDDGEVVADSHLHP